MKSLLHKAFVLFLIFKLLGGDMGIQQMLTWKEMSDTALGKPWPVRALDYLYSASLEKPCEKCVQIAHGKEDNDSEKIVTPIKSEKSIRPDDIIFVTTVSIEEYRPNYFYLFHLSEFLGDNSSPPPRLVV